MSSRTKILERGTPLARALPGAQFAELHTRVIDRSDEEVWAAYHAIRWNELGIAKALLAVRSLGWTINRLDRRLVEPPSPAAPIFSEPPRFSSSGMVGRPWNPKGGLGPAVASLEDLKEFDEPGWLKYGMELVLVPLPGDRTFVETATICEATDAKALRRFGLYWTLIRAFSGLIRHEILAALARTTSHRQLIG